MRPNVKGSLDKLRTLGADLAQAENGLAAWIKNAGQVELDLLQKALNECKPMIRQMMMQNYQASGIGKRDAKPGEYHSRGNLEKAIASATMRIPLRGKPRVSIVLPKGPDYRSPKGKTRPFNVVASALNYGAVRMQKVSRLVASSAGGGYRAKKVDPLGAKPKRSLKNKALGLGISDRSIGAIERDITSRAVGGVIRQAYKVGQNTKESDKSIQVDGGKGGGGYTVIKPKYCFSLTGAQQDQIAHRMEELIDGWLGNA